MNSLELFNQIYTNENERAYSVSLLDFFKTEIKKRLPSSPHILDIGSGSKSLFEEELGLDQNQITAIDFSPVAIEKAKGASAVTYLQKDMTLENVLESECFDLIFDSHCLHCITEIDQREVAFKNILHALKPLGIATFEMMVYPAGRAVQFPGKYIVSARDLEQEILAHGFKIIYFMIVRDLVFENENIKCDLVRVICRK